MSYSEPSPLTHSDSFPRGWPGAKKGAVLFEHEKSTLIAPLSVCRAVRK